MLLHRRLFRPNDVNERCWNEETSNDVAQQSIASNEHLLSKENDANADANDEEREREKETAGLSFSKKS